ncbi:hypothetical protein PTKIN_Ptkin10aG0052800 [Pterospermum kingtungense]
MSNEHITKRAKLKLTLHDFYKKPIDGQSSGTNSSPNTEVASAPKSQVKVENVEKATIANDLYLERDPSLRLLICSYHVDNRDNVVLHQIGTMSSKIECVSTYSICNSDSIFSTFLVQSIPMAYSEARNRAYCFPRYLFDTSPSRYVAFTCEGFQDWKRVKDGKRCAFAQHEGRDHGSLHCTALEK